MVISLASSQFEYLRRLVMSRSGVVLPMNQRYQTEARLSPLARQQGLRSAPEMIRRLEDTAPGNLQDLVVEALLPRQTAFFRDVHPFRLLKTQIFPMLEIKRYDQRRLAIWCAGCADGQEAYSVAMMIHLYFPQLLDWNLQIIATDFSEAALEHARLGRYRESEVRNGLTPYFVKYCMRPDGEAFVVKDEIRRLVRFQRINLIDEWTHLGEMDVVFLRNVLSYFALEEQKSVLTRLSRVLKPDGYLLLGAQETTLEADPAYDMVPTDTTVFFKPREISGSNFMNN